MVSAQLLRKQGKPPNFRSMRLFYFIALFAFLGMQANAQALIERNPWWWGVNMGGTFQTSDMKPLGGFGWGITATKYSRMSKPGPLYFGARFRFQDGRNYGYNYNALTGLQSNPVLSNGATNYAANGGYVFSNYKFRYDEFALELIIGSNSLRKSGFLLYGFGGVGMNYWKTTTNQLDENGMMYNYSGINKFGMDNIVRGQLEALWDDTYETAADGSPTAQWSFMPSAGFGMGYQFGRAFAIGIEHRSTFALNDVIDGTRHDYSGAATPNNDMYHYAGMFIRWTFGRAESTTSTNNPPPPPPNPNSYNTNPNPNNPTNPNPVVTNPPPTNPNQTPVNPNNPVQLPPIVTFTTPATNPFTATVPTQNLVVRVERVLSSNQISLTINGQVSTAFNFNPTTNIMTFSHNLLAGTNTYSVIATNNAGSASDNQTIIYSQTNSNPNNNGVPPQVTITNPGVDPFTSVSPTTNVTASVVNVTSQANVQVKRNGVAISGFSFNPVNGQVTFTANLQQGANTYEVIGTNNFGSASDVVTINYNPVQTIQPPVVTITSPNVCPYSTKTASMTITATVTNVTTMSQVAITFNNAQVTNFTFNVANGVATVSFPASFVNGSNNLTITGTNTAGTNSKSCVITYKTTQASPPPVVTITTPSSSPFISPTQNTTVIATVLNVNSQSDITVTQNNAAVSSFSFNASTKVVTITATLTSGNNVFTVTGTNSVGSDSKSTTIAYTPAPVVQPPVVNITTPSANPFITSTPQQTVIATVLNVTSASQITVKRLNGTDVTFNYNGGANTVTFSDNCVPGANVYTVTATNSAGSANDATTIKVVNTNPGGGAQDPGNNNSSPTPTQQPGNSRPGQTTLEPPSNPSNPPPPNPTNPSPTPTPTPSDPVITLVTPSSNNYNSPSQQLAVTMQVTGITSASQFGVKVNGVRMMSGINFNAQTGTVTFTANLNQGTNTIEVKAQNNVGYAQNTLTVTYGNSRSQNTPSKPTPTKTEPKKTEPKKAEPSKTEPKKTEVKKDTPAPKPSPSRPTTTPQQETPTPARPRQ